MTSALDLLMDSDSTAETATLESNGVCTIDSRTRTIFVPPEIVVGAVQSDKNAERIQFSCSKIVGDNLDLSKFSIRINFENVSRADSNISIKDQYICEDASINGDNITFSWVVGKNAARYMGPLRFIVCAVKTDSDSNISIEWNTTVAQIPVLEGIEIDQPSLDENNKDVINQLLAITKTASDEAVKNVNSAKEQAIKDIQNISQPDKTLTIEGGIADAEATGNAISSLREEISDYAYINYPYPFTQDSSLIGSDNVTKFYTQKMGGIKYLSIVESECNFKEYYVQTFYATSDIAIISIRGNLYDGTTPFYAEYRKPRAEAEKEITFNSEQYPLTKIHAIIDWNKVNAGYGQNLTEESAKIQEQCIVRNSSNIKIYVVDKSGKGDYTKIQDAIDAASDGDIIYVKSGMYEESVVNTKQVTLIGQDKESTVLFNTTGEYNTPPLWTCSGKIENLTVYAWNRDNKNVEEISNLGYAFHLDQKWATDVNDRHIEIKNCIFKSDFGDCIGCGMDAGAKIEISNCICEPTLKSGIKIHPFPTTGTSKILLRNNIFKVGSDSNAYGILFHTGGTDGTNFNTIEVEAYYNIAKTYDGWDNNCFKMNPYNYGNTLAGMNAFTI
nr:MAG TPA: Polysaccharide Lyase Family 6 enzyme, LYASE [Caudoviricetes sp.]